MELLLEIVGSILDFGKRIDRIISVIKLLVSKHCGTFTSRLHTFVDSQLFLFLIDVSKSKLRILLSYEIYVFDLAVFKAKTCFSKVFQISGTPCFQNV